MQDTLGISTNKSDMEQVHIIIFVYNVILHKVIHGCKYRVNSEFQIRCIKFNFNRLYLCYFLTKFYVIPLVRDDSNKWSNIGFIQGRGIKELKIHLILIPALYKCNIQKTSARY